MNKTFKIYAIIFIIIMVIMALLEVNKNEVVDWRKNFDVNKKTPFGLFVFNKEAENLFKDKLKRIEDTPYDFYNNSSKEAHNILVLETEVDIQSWKKILDQVSKGSDAMLFVNNLPTEVSEKIGITISQESFGDKNVLKLTDDKYQNVFLTLDKFPSGRGISYIKPKVEILGTSIDEDSRRTATFIKTNYGKGNIYVHTEPLFLTNYYLLKSGNTQYTQDVFSYLPNRDTLWFVESNTKESSSLMRFILSKPALKYAWWIFLGGLLLFVFFNAKRKQRVVPIIEPLKNNSLDFVKSIGNLYLQEGDFHDMMAKKAQYFLNKVRLELLIDTQNLNEEFAKKLHLKTGKPLDKISEAIILINKAQNPYANVMKEDLIKMNKILDEILK